MARCSAKNANNSCISYMSFISYTYNTETLQSFPHENTHFWVVGVFCRMPQKVFWSQSSWLWNPRLPNQGVPKPGLHLNKTQNQWDKDNSLLRSSSSLSRVATILENPTACSYCIEIEKCNRITIRLNTSQAAGRCASIPAHILRS